MTKRIFRAIMLVALCVLLAALTLFMGVLYRHFTNVQFAGLDTQAALAAYGVERDGLDYLQGLDDAPCRITWIAADGTVLYDNRSDSDDMENHLQRQEIVQALEEGSGQSLRYSDTLLERSLYAARLLSDGSVLRLSETQSSALNLLLGMLQFIAVGLVLAVVLSLSLPAFAANEATDGALLRQFTIWVNGEETTASLTEDGD